LKSNENAVEVSYLVPKDQTSNFKRFFETLDSQLDEYEVKSYGVSMTSLEEVFLNINDQLGTNLLDSRRMKDKKKKLYHSNLQTLTSSSMTGAIPADLSKSGDSQSDLL
jgi:hypothetical protein